MATRRVAATRHRRPRRSTDRDALREFLERDRLFAAYAICDLDEREFGRDALGRGVRRRRARSPLALEYAGPVAAAAVRHGRDDGIDGDPARRRSGRASPTSPRCPATLPAVEPRYRVDPGPPMVRMWVDRAHFRPVPGRRPRAPAGRHRRAEPALRPRASRRGCRASSIAEGVYYGIRVGGRLVAAAGTHVISRAAPGSAVVGNVLTHHRVPRPGLRQGRHGRRHRGAAAVLRPGRPQRPLGQPAGPGRLSAARLRGALRFEERLVHRLGPPWADLAVGASPLLHRARRPTDR